MQFTPCQEKAFALLTSSKNVFLTGAAGTGKSYLVQKFLGQVDRDEMPILASTGTAALLVGGRTFHSFFGLGILEGGSQATIERALRNRKLKKRLRGAKGFIVDEISMLSGETLSVAEKIAQATRESTLSWGGLRVVAVGDFAQLPPVSRHSSIKDWAFKSDVWARSDFALAALRTQVRSQDPGFLSVLGKVRVGVFDQEVRAFFESRQGMQDNEFEGTRIFPHRQSSENYNLQRLKELEAELAEFATEYIGDERTIESMKKSAPVPEILRLKVGALVMMRQNDLEGAWVNGSLGYIQRIQKDYLTIALMSGPTVEVKRAKFTNLDADGKEVGSAHNFPINLAYAATIHKTQGATLDRMCVNLKAAWEHGQTYVALSRVRRARDLWIENWSPNCVLSDDDVLRSGYI